MLRAKTVKRFTGGILCKISKVVYLQELQRGSVYMNRLDYYTKRENQENGDGFLDREEGLVAKDVNITLETNGQTCVIENASACMGMATPVFCCSVIKIPDRQDESSQEFFLDPRLIHDFSNGDSNGYGVLLISKEEFLQRVKQAADHQSLIYYMGNIQYKKFENSPENINDFSRAIFRKDPKFAYQCEYRIALRRSIEEAFRLEIGDISDISFRCNLDILRHPIRVQIEK